MAQPKFPFPPGNPHRSGSKAEELFLFHVKLCGLVEPVREYKFSVTTKRRWRFDFAWPDLGIAVEIEGVTHYGQNRDGSTKLSRHQTSRGYQNDLDKYNTATLEGWRVLRFSQHHVKSGAAIEILERLLSNQNQMRRTAT